MTSPTHPRRRPMPNIAAGPHNQPQQWITFSIRRGTASPQNRTWAMSGGYAMPVSLSLSVSAKVESHSLPTGITPTAAVNSPVLCFLRNRAYSVAIAQSNGGRSFIYPFWWSGWWSGSRSILRTMSTGGYCGGLKYTTPRYQSKSTRESTIWHHAILTKKHHLYRIANVSTSLRTVVSEPTSVQRTLYKDQTKPQPTTPANHHCH